MLFEFSGGVVFCISLILEYLESAINNLHFTGGEASKLSFN